MIRRFLAVALFAVATVSSQTPPSLPSSFQAKTIHGPEGADIFVRFVGSSGRRSHEGPYGSGAGSPGYWALLQACRRLR